jgi:hypothetical protein
MGKLSDEIKTDTGELARKPTAQVDPAVAARVRSFWQTFASDLPSGATARGRYAPVDGDRYLDMAVEVPDGTYRVLGADWVLQFKQNRLVSAVLARPPDFGGRRVTEV